MPSTRIARAVLTALLTLGSVGIAQAQVVLYVDKDAPPGGEGFSWETAFDDLAGPLEAAVEAAVFDIVFKVADGVYTPDQGTGETDRFFPLKSEVRVEGGYGGISEADPNIRDISLFETILSGDLLGDDVGFTNRDDNSNNVLRANGAGETAQLDGFTVVGGQGSNGGGLQINSASPTISNCTFRDNFASNGGAIWSNTNATLRSCRFISNEASVGGAISLFQTPNNSVLRAVNCAFFDNVAATVGGAIYASNSGSGSSIKLTNSVFSGNSAGNSGGAVWTAYVTLTAFNCTFSNNFAPIGRTSSLQETGTNTPTYWNCILWNGGQEISGRGVRVKYSNVQFGWPGDGNIFAPPRFVDALGEDGIAGTEDDDLRLSRNSHSIDAGASTLVPEDDLDIDDDDDVDEQTPLDLDNQPRFADDPATEDTGIPGAFDQPVVDMGAYEFQGSSCLDVDDCDGDGVLDAKDNCPGVANAGQENFDNDGDGDACDEDTDDDGVPTAIDPCDFTSPETMIDATGRPIGDHDGDCDVDLVDYSLFFLNFTGAP